MNSVTFTAAVADVDRITSSDAPLKSSVKRPLDANKTRGGDIQMASYFDGGDACGPSRPGGLRDRELGTQRPGRIAARAAQPETPTTRSRRLSRLHDAVAAGEYAVNAERVADRIISLETALGRNTQG